MLRSWGFAKTIAPLLLAGVFVSGIVKVVLPQEFVTNYVGSNSLSNMFIPVIFGVLVYFPTLVEVPMAKAFLISAWQKARFWPISFRIPCFRSRASWLSAKSWGQKELLSMYALSSSLPFSADICSGYCVSTLK